MARPPRPADRTQLLLFDAEQAAREAAPAPPPRPSLVPPAFRHPNAERELLLDGHRVAYAFRRARRRSIGFVVGVEGLSVSAPRWVGIGDVETALREKSGWILRKLAEQAERGRRQAAARVDWRDGAELPFLGRPLQLRFDGSVTGAILEPAGDAAAGPARLRLGLPPAATGAQVRDLVQGWLQRQARRLFEERCALYAPRLGVRVARVGLSDARTRWGSASADGSIRLNWRLVHLAMPTIDYVVAHELAHLRHMDHSPRFWDVVRSVIPDVEARRGALRDEVLPVLD